MKKLLVVGATTFVLTFSVAAQTLTLPFDSTWEYGSAVQGNGSRKAWSNLQSYKKDHTSSVKIAGKTASSGKKKKGVWSKSSAYGSFWDSPSYYYYFY